MDYCLCNDKGVMQCLGSFLNNRRIKDSKISKCSTKINSILLMCKIKAWHPYYWGNVLCGGEGASGNPGRVESSD